MTNSFRKTLAIATLAAAGVWATHSAHAQCGPLANPPPQMQPQSWFGTAPARAVFVVDEKVNDDIVGFWNIAFTSRGTQGIPDGTVIDKGMQQWHADGTEFLNSSGQKPLTQNFCLGTWAKIGKATYSLNHFAYNYDASQNLIGLTRIRELVTVGVTKNTFSGTFVIDGYDTVCNPVAHLTGTVSANRITVNTTAQEII